MVYRSFFMVVILLLMAVAGFAQTNVTLSFKVGTTTNSCVFHVPAGVDKPPVVFYVHGANGSGANLQKEIKADAVADREKFIAVYPSATNNGATGTWSDMRGPTHFPFFKAVLDTLDKRYGIDRDRVYMTGFSQGGFISFVAGCSFSDIFAAIAPVSGHAGSPCTIKRPVPVYLAYGAQEDKNAFVNDLAIWQKLDSCPSTSTVTKPVSGVTKVAYGPCAQGSYVVMDSISGQGHQWPTKQNHAEEVWKFFKQFSLKNTTGTIVQQKAAASTSPVGASYLFGSIRLKGVGDDCRVRVLDTRGRQIAGVTPHNQQFSFKNKPSGVYMVMISANDNTSAVRVVIP